MEVAAFCSTFPSLSISCSSEESKDLPMIFMFSFTTWLDVCCCCGAAFIHIDRWALNDICCGFSASLLNKRSRPILSCRNIKHALFLLEKTFVVFFYKRFSPFMESSALSLLHISRKAPWIPRLATVEKISKISKSFYQAILVSSNSCCGTRATQTTRSCIRSRLLTWELMPVCRVPIAEHSWIWARLGRVFGQCVRERNPFCVVQTVAGFRSAKVVKSTVNCVNMRVTVKNFYCNTVSLA